VPVFLIINRLVLQALSQILFGMVILWRS